MSSETDTERAIGWAHLGRISFCDALHLQRFNWHRVKEQPDDIVLTLEHDPVVTLGRRADPADLLLPETELLRRGIEVVRADRGGEVTYHGPGQLVIYVNALLQRFRAGPADIVRTLAAAIADVLADLGIDAVYDPEHPGLWVSGRKIAAVGMRISRGASLHGAALNLTTDLDAFSLFVPCGMPGALATSVTRELQTPDRNPQATPTMEVMAEAIARRVAERLGAQFSVVDAPALLARARQWTEPTEPPVG